MQLHCIGCSKCGLEVHSVFVAYLELQGLYFLMGIGFLYIFSDALELFENQDWRS
jgi:hypothetical protein